MTLSPDFTTTTHAKWLLAGEHAVLRNHPALVFPVPSKTLTLDYWQVSPDIRAEFSGEFGEDAHLLFWSVLEHGLNLVNQSLSDIQGKFQLQNSIRIGAGMGASAALCAALSRWFIWKNFIAENELHSFAQELEHLFHGKSSGVDIAGALANTGVLFHSNTTTPIPQKWQPCWYLSFTEQIGITSHCVKKVNDLWQKNFPHAQAIDLQMASAVSTALAALNEEQSTGLPKLVDAILCAKQCFNHWGLANDNIEQHIEKLMQAGALACKPTGSGDGGYVLSLWREAPPEGIRRFLVAV